MTRVRSSLKGFQQQSNNLLGSFNCALGKGDKISSSSFILISEDKFIRDAREVYHKIGGVFIVVSEGLRDEKGNYVCARKGI